MKITNIEQQENIFIVTKSPNLLQSIFGLKTKVEKYKDIGTRYEYFKSVHVYINQKGEVLGAVHKMTDILDAWRIRF